MALYAAVTHLPQDLTFSAHFGCKKWLFEFLPQVVLMMSTYQNILKRTFVCLSRSLKSLKKQFPKEGFFVNTESTLTAPDQHWSQNAASRFMANKILENLFLM